MKKPTFLVFMLLLLISSCITKPYYQVYEVNSDKKMIHKQNELIFEDDHCIVSYNLWEEKGDIGFIFYNKTDETIYLNKDKCFFILNGFASRYFQERTYSSTSSFGVNSLNRLSASTLVQKDVYKNYAKAKQISTVASENTTSTQGYSVSYVEQRIIVVPGKTAKRISEFTVNDRLYRDCNLFKYPKSKQINTITFNESESPIVFSNRINYSLGHTEQTISFENTFYVSQITNYSTKEIFDYKYDEYCGQKSVEKTKYFTEYGPDKFYIKYEKGTDSWKH